MIKYCLFALSLVITGLGEQTNTHHLNLKERVKRIRIWRESTRILLLPFKASYGATTKGTYRVRFSDEDSDFRKDFLVGGDVYLEGFLPDTTNFYGIVFIRVRASEDSGLITFDKSGNMIDWKILTNEGCHPQQFGMSDILECEEYVMVNQNLSLNYLLKSKIKEYSATGGSRITKTAYEKSGAIDKSGKIYLSEKREIKYPN